LIKYSVKTNWELHSSERTSTNFGQYQLNFYELGGTFALALPALIPGSQHSDTNSDCADDSQNHEQHLPDRLQQLHRQIDGRGTQQQTATSANELIEPTARIRGSHNRPPPSCIGATQWS
jgi:hypothetical protein